jgi:hypothetical protein
MPVSTGLKIFRRAVLSLTITTKSINSFRYIYFTGLKPLAGWEMLLRGFWQYAPWRVSFWLAISTTYYRTLTNPYRG